MCLWKTQESHRQRVQWNAPQESHRPRVQIVTLAAASPRTALRQQRLAPLRAHFAGELGKRTRSAPDVEVVFPSDDPERSVTECVITVGWSSGRGNADRNGEQGGDPSVLLSVIDLQRRRRTDECEAAGELT